MIIIIFVGCNHHTNFFKMEALSSCLYIKNIPESWHLNIAMPSHLSLPQAGCVKLWGVCSLCLFSYIPGLSSYDLTSALLYALHSWLVLKKFKLKPSFTCWAIVRFNQVTKSLVQTSFFIHLQSFTNWKENWKNIYFETVGQSSWPVHAYCFKMCQGEQRRAIISCAIWFCSSEEVSLLTSAPTMELGGFQKC